MGVRGWLSRRAVRSAHVLVVAAPAHGGLRQAVEREVARRGWHLAGSAADADLLVVAGPPDPVLAGLVERLWDAMPGPRGRANVPEGDSLDEALGEGMRQLLDDGQQRQDASRREGFQGPSDDHGDMDHGDMDHGDMDMAPHGIPLASGDPEDRDGLEMDTLPLRLGPVLAHWPDGLVLDVQLHGDLVVRATARWLHGEEAHQGRVTDEQPLGALCDHVVAVLALAGWEHGASTARRVRDAVLDGSEHRAAAGVEDLQRLVRRSRTLRWALRGVGVVSAERATALGLPAHVVGDCHTRLLALVDRVAKALSRNAAGADDVPDGVPVDAIGVLVEGCDLGAARLVVATLGVRFAPAEAAARA